MNLIESFDQVRIINMVSRKDRRNETVSEFMRYGFQLNTDKVKFFDAITPNEAQGFPNLGVRGCFLSHLKILEEAKQSKSENILILEDDIQFSKHILEYGSIAIESLKDLDWDIAFLGHVFETLPDELTWKKVNQAIRLGHFYAVNGKTLERLTQCLNSILERPPGHPDGGPMHYDGALNTFVKQENDIQAYFFSKNLGYQRPSRTNIHKHSIFDKNFMLKHMTIVARKIKTKFLRFIR